MQLIYIIFICFVGLIKGQENGFEDEIGRAAGDLYCNIDGVQSGAKCLSQTHFVYNGEPATADPFQCASGTVCVDLPGICISGVQPACSNIEIEDPANASCADCNEALTCISQTEYAGCANGQPLTQFPRKCLPAAPYCQIVSTPAQDPANPPTLSQCTAVLADAQCIPAVTTPPPPPPPPPTDICTAVGLFRVSGDTTCKNYYSCYKDNNGQLVKTLYACSGTLVFNPVIQRCVATTAYNCPR